MIVGRNAYNCLNGWSYLYSRFMGFDAQCKMAVGTTPTTAWLLVLLEGRGASAASYPAQAWVVEI